VVVVGVVVVVAPELIAVSLPEITGTLSLHLPTADVLVAVEEVAVVGYLQQAALAQQMDRLMQPQASWAEPGQFLRTEEAAAADPHLEQAAGVEAATAGVAGE
jgi:hypothetical protein